VLAIAGLGVLTAALVEAGRLGWASPVARAGCVVSAGGLRAGLIVAGCAFLAGAVLVSAWPARG